MLICLLQGQVNMIGAVQRDLHFTDPKTGKKYALNDEVATLIVSLFHAT